MLDRKKKKVHDPNSEFIFLFETNGQKNKQKK